MSATSLSSSAVRSSRSARPSRPTALKPGRSGRSPKIASTAISADGPRLLTNIVGVDPEPDALPLDLSLEVVYEPAGGITLPLFRPADP